MSSANGGAPGFLGSIQALGENVLGSLHDHLALFSTELQEEKFRLIQTLLWVSAAVFTAVMAVTFASLTLVYLLWESSRLAVLGGMTAFFGGALAAVAITFRRFLARQPRPFAGTLHEISEDRACFQTRN